MNNKTGVDIITEKDPAEEWDKTEIENPKHSLIGIKDNLPIIPDKKWIEQYKEFLSNYNEFIDSQMIEGTDYGTIPGTKKPTLLQAGAQKLEKLFFLRSESKQTEKIVKEDYEFIKYAYKTFVYRGDILVATCEGTCNSRETKYRYRWIPEWEASDQIKETIKAESRQAKSGKKYNWYKMLNTELAEVENTIMKMAQKRSYVGAVLIATNSSGRFTQDMEDMKKPETDKKEIIPVVDVVDYDEEGFSRPLLKVLPPREQFASGIKPRNPAVPFPNRTGPRTTANNPVQKLFCSDCAKEITLAEVKFSEDKYSFRLCRTCQGEYKARK